MLSAREFITGSAGDATPLTLVLPRHAQEIVMLVGGSADRPVALCLSGSHCFHSFLAVNNRHWFGILISGVRVEVDEASIGGSNYGQSLAGTVIRKDSRLLVQPAGYNDPAVVLEEGLPATIDGAASFSRWQVVLGAGVDKRVLHTVSLNQADP